MNNYIAVLLLSAVVLGSATWLGLSGAFDLSATAVNTINSNMNVSELKIASLEGKINDLQKRVVKLEQQVFGSGTQEQTAPKTVMTSVQTPEIIIANGKHSAVATIYIKDLNGKPVASRKITITEQFVYNQASPKNDNSPKISYKYTDKEGKIIYRTPWINDMKGVDDYCNLPYKLRTIISDQENSKEFLFTIQAPNCTPASIPVLNPNN